MTAMPSPKYLRETANKALIHSARPGSGTMPVFLAGLEFKKDRYIVVCILDGETF